jgi:RNA polymerase sigma-70 factor (ECF subfamily)
MDYKVNPGKKIDSDAVSEDVLNRKRKYDLLIDAHSADLYRYAHWKCRDRLQAEEVMQETFLRAWRSIDKLRDASASKAWLFTIFRREYARQFERKQLAYQDVENMDTVSNVHRDFDTSPEAFALRRALASLSEDYREPLVMQVLGGYSCEEIAKELDISASAVMTRLFRARKQLRDILEKDDIRFNQVNK